MLKEDGLITFYPAKVDIFHSGIILFEMLSLGLKPYMVSPTEDDKIYRYIQLDRCDLFFNILSHEQLYKNHKNLTSDLKNLLSYTISFLSHERPSAGETLAFIKEINKAQDYDVTQETLKE